MFKKTWQAALGVMLAFMLLAGALPAAADGTAVIGTLVITNPNPVNIRSGGGTSYEIVGRAMPGDFYEVASVTNTGWYEIMLDDGSTGFVSGNLTQFTPSPIGGGRAPAPGNTSQVRATVAVYYRTETGQNLATDYVTLSYGGNNVLANDAKVPAGYALASARRVTVNVNASGVASPSAVIFTYRGGQPARTQAQVPIYYKDVFGNLLNTGYITLQPGSSLITPDGRLVPAGYQLVGPKDVVVSVSMDYLASPASVTFVYTKVAATPQPVVTAMVPVFYRTTQGAFLNTAYLSLNAGATNVTYNPQLVPAGYMVVGPVSQTVTVSASGLATPASVTFLLAQSATPTPVIYTSLPVYYRSASGAYLNTDYVAVTQGTNTVQAADRFVPRGYTLAGARTQQVTVDAYGNPSPSSLTFYYFEPMPVLTPAPTAAPTPVPSYGYIVPEKGFTVGDKGPSVAALQTALRNKGLYKGDSTGTYDDALWQAVWHFQRNNGMDNTGVADAKVFEALGLNITLVPSPTAVPTPTPAPSYGYIVPEKGFTVGDKGPSVAALQTVLRNKGLYKGDSTGTYDNALWQAVWHFQRNNGMDITGVADAKVFEALGLNVTTTPAQPAPQQPPAAGQPGAPMELPSHVVVSAVRGSWPVYSGPGPGYYRVGNATLGGGRIRVYGQEDGWVLIGYGTSNGGYRIGFVSPQAIPADVTPPVLQLGWQPMQNNSTNLFTDDPIVGKNRVLSKNYPAGNTFNVLAFLDRWAYVEITAFEGGPLPIRGFISKRSLGL